MTFVRFFSSMYFHVFSQVPLFGKGLSTNRAMPCTQQQIIISIINPTYQRQRSVCKLLWRLFLLIQPTSLANIVISSNITNIVFFSHKVFKPVSNYCNLQVSHSQVIFSFFYQHILENLRKCSKAMIAKHLRRQSCLLL